jgi:hypothetical protein
MQTQTKRIEVQFPPAPPSRTLIGVTNHGVTASSSNVEDLRDALTQYPAFPFSEDRLERRGIPESALHD